MKVEPTDWEALARFISGECTPAEAEEIRDWLEADPSRRRLLDELGEHLSRYVPSRSGAVDVEAGLAAVRARIEAEPVSDIETARTRQSTGPDRRRMVASGWLRIAAVLMLVAGAALLWRLLISDAPSAASSFAFSTGVGQTESVDLPDGTRVVLGPGSQLTAASGYADSRRELSLSGQAFFEVADHPTPFIVRAGSTEIEDLGTAFTVHADPEGPVRVAVTSGTVAVRPPAATGGTEVVLREGDKAALRAAELIVDRGSVGDADLVWMRGTLAFQDAPISDVAFDFRRWFGMALVVADPDLAGRRITATFTSETPAEAAQVIGLALGADLEVRGDTAVLSLRRGASR